MAKLQQYPTHLAKELIDSYINTEYWVFAASPFCIKIEGDNTSLYNFLQKNKCGTWAFITAWNPHSEQKDLLENNHQNKLLENEIIQASLNYYLAEGRLGNWSEQSFFIMNISKEKAMSLARKFHQNAILFGNSKNVELVFINYEIIDKS